MSVGELIRQLQKRPQDQRVFTSELIEVTGVDSSVVYMDDADGDDMEEPITIIG